MKKLMDIEYPLWSGGQPCVCVFFSFFSVWLKRVKSGGSHCQGISKVNRLLYLAHIFTFFMVCSRAGGVQGDEEEEDWGRRLMKRIEIRQSRRVTCVPLDIFPFHSWFAALPRCMLWGLFLPGTCATVVVCGRPDRPVVIRFPRGPLCSSIVLMPSLLSCGLICGPRCKSMLLGAIHSA